jgi:hypothetical protein
MNPDFNLPRDVHVFSTGTGYSVWVGDRRSWTTSTTNAAVAWTQRLKDEPLEGGGNAGVREPRRPIEPSLDGGIEIDLPLL